MLQIDTAALWAALGSDLRRYVVRRTGDTATAEDLLQEIFLRVHRKSEELRDDDRVAAWVFRIARSVVIDHLRTKARERTVPELPDDGNAAPDHSDAAEPDAQDDGADTLAHWLAAMVATLPPPYAEAVRLADLEGVSQVEAASLLGLSHSGFKSRVQRGRAKLRDILDRCCAVELDTRGGLIDYHPRKGCC